MLKRLTVMIFVLGLVFAFAGQAYSEGTGPDLTAKQSIKDLMGAKEAPAKAMAQPGTVVSAEFQRPIVDVRQVTSVPSKNTSASPDINACYEQDYFDYANSFDVGCFSVSAYQFNGGDTDMLAMRFSVPEHHAADVSTVYVWVGESTANVGTGCDLVVTFYDDNAGLPDGAPLYSFTVDMSPYNPLAWSGGWLGLSLPTPLTVYGDYHVAINSAGDASDYLLFLGDSPTGCGCEGTGRASYYYTPDDLWYTAEGAFGVDRNYALTAEQCIYYTECYEANSIAGGTGSVWVWYVPDPAWTSAEILTGFGQRFFSAGPDTVNYVQVRHITGAYWEDAPYALFDATSTNTVEVSIWGDDGLGGIDVGSGPLATEIVSGINNIFSLTGNADPGAAWDRFTVDFTSHNLVVNGPWHVTARMTSANDADGIVLMTTNSGTGNPGFTGGSAYFDPSGWATFPTSATWADEVAFDLAFYVRVGLCKDEYYECKWALLYDDSPHWVWAIGELGWAQKVQGKPRNRVEELWFYAYDLVGDGSAEFDVYINADAGAAGPGAVLGGPYHVGPRPSGWANVVIPGGVVADGDFFVSLMYAGTGTPSVVTEDSDHAGIHTPINGGAWLHYGGAWTIGADLGLDDNLILEVYFCSVPVTEIACVPGDDWVTVGHDYARTGHSGNAVGDAWCDLTLTGMWEHPTFGSQRNGPIVFSTYEEVAPGDTVRHPWLVQSFSSGVAAGYYVFDLDNIAAGPIDSITTNNYSEVIGGSVRCTPTFGVVGGIPMLFIAGGTANAVGAYDMSVLPGITQVWAATPYNGWLGHNSFVSSVRYGVFALLDDGLGTDVFYYMDDAANVYAINALTGAPYAGWTTNPYALGNPSYKSLTSDGTNLYFATSVPGGYGNILAVDAFTGALVWDLAAGDGLQGSVYWDDVTDESFNGGISVADGELYVNSAVGAYLADGVFYRLNAVDGTVLSTAQSISDVQNHPIIDAANAVVLGLNGWVNAAPLGGTVLAFDRVNGAQVWAGSPPEFDFNEAWYRYEGLMTCEPDVADLLFAFNGGASLNNGYLSCFDGNTGEELFHRRVDHGAGANLGGGGAVALDSNGDVHIVFVDAWGTLYDLTKGVDRPRFELLAPAGTQAVPFGTSYDTVVVFPDMYTNTGCTDLIVTMVADEATNGVTPASPGFRMVSQRLMDDMSNVADLMTNNVMKNVTLVPFDMINNVDVTRDESRLSLNRAASAVPAFLVDAGAGDVFFPTGGGFVTAPGENADIAVRVNGPAVNRGPQSFYVEFQHNDPDYFLNDNTLLPEARLTLVGGCLTELVSLEFGMGGANSAPIFNMGRLANGGAETFDIDATGGMYQGTYIYATGQYNVALNSQDWHGGAEDEAYKSMQADPNWCDDDCTPMMTTDVSLGFITNDGLTYSEILGTSVCKSMIDSVQNFDDGFGGWDWTLTLTAPFDNALTMGIGMNSTTIAALNDTVTTDGLLNNVIVEKMTFFERNGAAVPGWKFGAFIDYDIRGLGPAESNVGDTAFIDRDLSVAWCADVGNDAIAMGMVKIPFGCGETPLKNVGGLDANYAMFSDVYLDSAYYYMNLPEGDFSHQIDGILSGTQDDEEWHVTLAEHDWVGSDTITFGVANFGFYDLPDTYTSDGKIGDLASLVNKWAGFGRGDVNNDGVIGLADIIYLADYVNGAGTKPGPIPFMHCGDVDAGTDGVVDMADVTALVDYYFNATTMSCLPGVWTF